MLADGLARSLRQAGYAVDWVDSAERAQLAVEHETFDLVILDIGLPGSDGFEWLRQLRKGARYMPVIVVTARDAVTERVRGLEARVRALIRRGRVPTAPRVALSALSLDLVAREARVHGELLDLTAREWAIMELFVTQPGVALSKDRIVQSLSSWDEKLSHNAIEVYVSRLRTKLEPAGVRIRTVRGFGYMLETPRA